MKYAQVIIFKKLGEFDNELTYKVPENLVSKCNAGLIVEIPFQNRILKGIITRITSVLPADLSDKKVKMISNILKSPKLLPQQIELVRFISNYYQTSMGRALRLFFPKQLWNGKLEPPTSKIYHLADMKPVLRGEKQKMLFEIIRQNGGLISLSDLNKRTEKISNTVLKSLAQKGVIEEVEEPVFKPFDNDYFKLKKPDKVLTSDQNEALKQIQKSEKPVLIHGVTGSGKTEIYLRQILQTIQKGKQAILLVPEIALTPQMIRYFKDYLGDRIALFHSQLSDTERAKEWWKVKSKYSPLIIGSRSAIFAPVENLGLIILDEEHEWTYKQESSPYYQTHRIAEEMQKIWKARLILGSSTPSAESYKKAKEKKYLYFHLPERVYRREMPQIHVVDLRDEFKKRNFSILSLLLQNKIKERLKNHEQIILFVNQRGLSNAVVCRDCGYTEKCPHCEISLKYHRHYETRNSKLETRKKSQIRNLKSEIDRLVCHYCTYSKVPELLCPECKSPYIKHIGVGTQRVEEEVHRLFPQARVIRADRDTTQNREGFSAIYRDFLEHKYDILIGTQMIAKGLDFSKVSLIGIVLADIGLHIPDFRSSERLFQILTQVAGRCGRREKPGEVVLQTYNPDHPTIKKTASYQYNEFIENELKQRSQLGYPPFNRMIKFTVVGNDQEKLSKHIKTEQEVLEDIFKVNDLKVKIISAPALIPKVANRYYFHVLLRAKDPNIIFQHWKPPKGWRVDVDPIHTA